MSAGDIDKVMSSGLGTRYAFIGPWETAYLNAEGVWCDVFCIWIPVSFCFVFCCISDVT